MKRIKSQLQWWWKLLCIFFSMNVRSTISYYRWSFLWAYVAHVLGYVNSYIIIWASMRAFDGILNWSMQDVMFIYSLDLFSYSLANMFVQPFWDMDGLVGKGKLDDFLVRPLPPLLHLMMRNVQFAYIAHISVSIVAFIGILKISNMAWTPLQFFQLVITLIGAFLLQCSFGIMPACAAFRWIQADNFASFIRWDVREFIKYPIIIYPIWLRFGLSFIIPVAFVNYYPSIALLSKGGGLMSYGPYYTLLLGVFLFAVTLYIWKKSLQRYSSSG